MLNIIIIYYLKRYMIIKTKQASIYLKDNNIESLTCIAYDKDCSQPLFTTTFYVYTIQDILSKTI